MQKIIIIRGAPSSGKSTIAKKFRNFKDRIVWLKVDNFKDFFGDDASLALNYVNSTALASLKHLSDEGFTVVVEGIFQDTKVIAEAESYAIQKKIPIKVFQLYCPLEVLQKRDLHREGVKEGHRRPLGNELIQTIFKKLEDTYYEGAIKLDTDKNDLEKCIDTIKNSF